MFVHITYRLHCGTPFWFNHLISYTVSQKRNCNGDRRYPKGPCTHIVYTLALKYSLYRYIGPKVYPIWVHGPLGVDLLRFLHLEKVDEPS